MPTLKDRALAAYLAGDKELSEMLDTLIDLREEAKRLVSIIQEAGLDVESRLVLLDQADRVEALL